MTDANYIGQQFGSYIIIEPINSGTFGGVFKARHMIFGDDPIVAIKIMHSHFISQEEHALFIQEAQLLKRLKHPYILPIIDAGIQNRTPYIITEYAAGGTLKDRIERQAGRPFPIDEAIHILTQVGEALHFAHEQEPHVVHRDLKPANILFNAKGDALLADFGIAAILNTLITKWLGSSGTPAYMAPEQFDGLVSVKSDQYALGCIAYELITGRRPYNLDGTNALVAQYQHSSVQPVAPTYYNPRIPTHIEAAIGTAIAKDRNNRHRNVAAFIAALQKTAKQWYEEGCGLYSLNRHEEALAAFEQALRLDPNFALAHNNGGMALWGLNRYEEALVAFEQALHLDPNFALAHNNRGMALDCFNRHEEALVAYEQALHLDPSLALAHNNRGMALWNLNRHEEALAAFEQALHLDPNGDMPQ